MPDLRLAVPDLLISDLLISELAMPQGLRFSRD
jgi:hypothetical protein